MNFMAVVVNNPDRATDGGVAAATWVVAAVVIVAIVLGFLYLLPSIRNAGAVPESANINVTIPNAGGGEQSGQQSGTNNSNPAENNPQPGQVTPQ